MKCFFLITILSTNDFAVSNALNPAIGTARPSAKVDSIPIGTGFPSSRALENPGQRSDSTP